MLTNKQWNMQKYAKIYLLVILNLVCGAAAAQTGAYNFSENSLHYRIVSAEDSLVEVAGGDKDYRGETVIPDDILHGDTLYKVVSIADEAFKAHLYRSSFVLGKNLMAIGKRSFAQIPSLAAIDIPDGVNKIGEGAFYSCSHLTSIHIGAGVDSIPKDAFWGSAVNDLVIGKNVKYIGENAFLGLSGKLKSIVLPASVKHVCTNAFSHHMYVTRLDLGSVEKLEDGAFDSLLSLPEVSLPATVNSIVGNPFSCCSVLKTMKVSEDNAFFDSRDGCNAVINSQTNWAVSCCRASMLPEGIVGIGRNAMSFGNGGSKFELHLPSTIVQISNNTFSSQLTKVVIPDLRNWYDIYFYDNPLEYAHHLFVGDREITEIEVPNDVKALHSKCFSGMKGLTKVVLHENITDMGSAVFSGCPAIAEVDCSWKKPPVAEYLFDSAVMNNAVLRIPYGTSSYYKYYACWKYFKHIVEKDAPVHISGARVEEDSPTKAYNLHGMPVDMSSDSGVYITKDGKKIMR